LSNIGGTEPRTDRYRRDPLPNTKNFVRTAYRGF